MPSTTCPTMINLPSVETLAQNRHRNIALNRTAKHTEVLFRREGDDGFSFY